MPQRPSAEKSMRSNQARHERNQSIKSRLRTETVKFDRAIERSDSQQARQQLIGLTRLLHQAAEKGVIHKNTAARKQGRLQAKMNELAGGGS